MPWRWHAPRECPARWPPGTPLFGSFSGGPDIVNDANLNVHLSVPIREKNGLEPFYYVLTYDNSLWYPVGTTGSQAWQPVSGWGWRTLTPVVTGSITYNITQKSCHDLLGDVFYYNQYSGFAYTDPSGVLHQAPSSVTIRDYSALGLNCHGGGSSGTASALIQDDYGYTISASVNTSDSDGYDYYPWVTMYTRSGSTFVPAINSDNPNPPSPGITDTSSNSIQSSYSNGVTTFTDTLGKTALTVSGTGTPSSPVTLAYTAAQNQPGTATVQYAPYTVRTNFGCSGISEYGPYGTNLVSEIDMPDIGANPGDKYTFTYEGTTGYSGDTTGRLASVTLPTGGTINYSYSGGSNGITCADGSAATLTRTTPDGAWTYAHTESGSAWTTTLTDPSTNVTTFNFQSVTPTGSTTASAFETERQLPGMSRQSKKFLFLAK